MRIWILGLSLLVLAVGPLDDGRPDGAVPDVVTADQPTSPPDATHFISDADDPAEVALPARTDSQGAVLDDGRDGLRKPMDVPEQDTPEDPSEQELGPYGDGDDPTALPTTEAQPVRSSDPLDDGRSG